MSTLPITFEGIVHADGRTVTLKEPAILPPGPITFQIRETQAECRDVSSVLDFLRRNNEEKIARGDPGRTLEEIDADLDEIWGDDAYEQKWSDIHADIDAARKEANS